MLIVLSWRPPTIPPKYAPYGMDDFSYGMKMEWMEYGKIVFHSIPYHAVIDSRLLTSAQAYSLPTVVPERGGGSFPPCPFTRGGQGGQVVPD